MIAHLNDHSLHEQHSVSKSIPHALRLERDIDYERPYIGKTTTTDTAIGILSGTKVERSESESTAYAPIIYVVAVPSMYNVAIPRPFDITAGYYSEKSEVTEAEPPDIIQLHKRYIAIKDTDKDSLMKREPIDDSYSYAYGLGKVETHGYKYIPDTDKIIRKVQEAATELGVEDQLNNEINKLTGGIT